MQRHRYPVNWEEISLRIRKERARDRCEWCGAHNAQPHPRTGSKVILTTAHLGVPKPVGSPGNKHDKMDVREENLAALCQSCHLAYDRNDQITNRRYGRNWRDNQTTLDL